MNAQIAQIVNCTQAEGPGKRLAIWFQGCPLRCAECCNPEMLPFSGGESISLTEICDAISRAKSNHAIEGITLLGGEPFAHANVGSLIAQHARDLNLTVMIFSGYTLSEIEDQTASQQPDAGAVHQLLNHTDLLVDGRYEKENPDQHRRWIGSKNQSIHFLTNRYSASDEYWQQPDTLEIRLAGDEISVNGFPASQAVEFWRRPSKNG
jgi:anaerobic ribonucleoside-triphosphate reductase activating protein